MFLSAFSLPADFKNRTIYTIVTKPVRPGEIVLGRILGFAPSARRCWPMMGVTSYVFVVAAAESYPRGRGRRALQRPAGEGSRQKTVGRTTLVARHRHRGARSTPTAHASDRRGTNEPLARK